MSTSSETKSGGPRIGSRVVVRESTGLRAPAVIAAVDTSGEHVDLTVFSPDPDVGPSYPLHGVPVSELEVC